ncbi:hypothetical protein [Mogibacterium timidum]|uniref:hypothetical protein n=1 Tax=Mogibacterium timidum TaxID=35519 RepID=UPI00248C82DE|nr:hypothetical protein [Mogibacterium timidum]
MIRIDRKLSNAILKISDSYDSEFFYDIDENGIFFNDKLYSVPIDKSEIKGSLVRLIDAGYLIPAANSWCTVEFSISPELKHAKAFWFDRVSKRFIYGFISGVLTSVTAMLLVKLIEEYFL